MTQRANFYLGERLNDLTRRLGCELLTASPHPLIPTWVVTPTMAMRQHFDWGLSEVAGVSANFQYFFPEGFVAHVEQLVLASRAIEWQNFSADAIILRLLARNPSMQFAEASSLAGEFDDIVRWRPDAYDPSSLPEPLAALHRAENFDDVGPLAQRRRVLEILADGGVALPPHIVIYALAHVPGGPRFAELVAALGAWTRVDVLLPVPNVTRAASIVTGDVPPRGSSWLAEADEALQIWRGVAPEQSAWHFEGNSLAVGTTGVLQEKLRGRPVQDVPEGDGAVRVLGCVGNARQVEQLRDELLTHISSGRVRPEEILVVAPDLGSFENLLDRHWNYDERDGEGRPAPRLPYEIVERSPRANRTEALAILHFLDLIGNYVTREQVVALLRFPSVLAALDLDEEGLNRLDALAREAMVSFGTTAAQRAHFRLYDDGETAEAGTWADFIGRTVDATFLPELAGDEFTLGVPGDLSLLSAISRPLRLLDELSHSTLPDEHESLTEWLSRVVEWATRLGFSRDDGSLSRVQTYLGSLDPTALRRISFSAFREFWRSAVAPSTRPQQMNRAAVRVAPMSAMVGARYKIVCVLGLDEEKLPVTGLASPVFGASRPGDPNPRRAMLGALLQSILASDGDVVVTYNARDEITGAPLPESVALQELLGAVPSTDSSGLAAVQEMGARHGFLAVHETRTYDARYRGLAHVVETATQRSTPFRHEPEAMAPPTAVHLDDLMSFFRNPATYFFRHSVGASAPDAVGTEHQWPRVELDPLTKYELTSRFFNTALGYVPEGSQCYRDWSAQFAQDAQAFRETCEQIYRDLLDSPRIARDVAPLLRPVLSDTTLVESIFDIGRDLAAYEPYGADEPITTSPLRLPTGLELQVLSRTPGAGTWRPLRDFSSHAALGRMGAPATARVGTRSAPSEVYAREFLGLLVETLVLTAHSGEAATATRYLPYGSSPKRAARPPVVALTYLGTRAEALDDLASLVALFARGQREVLFLDRELTVAVLQNVEGALQRHAGGALLGTYAGVAEELTWPQTVREFIELGAEQGIYATLGAIAPRLAQAVVTPSKRASLHVVRPDEVRAGTEVPRQPVSPIEVDSRWAS